MKLNFITPNEMRMAKLYFDQVVQTSDIPVSFSQQLSKRVEDYVEFAGFIRMLTLYKKIDRHYRVNESFTELDQPGIPNFILSFSKLTHGKTKHIVTKAAVNYLEPLIDTLGSSHGSLKEQWKRFNTDFNSKQLKINPEDQLGIFISFCLVSYMPGGQKEADLLKLEPNYVENDELSKLLKQRGLGLGSISIVTRFANEMTAGEGKREVKPAFPRAALR